MHRASLIEGTPASHYSVPPKALGHLDIELETTALQQAQV